MSLFYYLKIKAYRFSNTSLGKSILKLLSVFVHAEKLKNGKEGKNLPFIVSVTIDTESGFVDENDNRVWQKFNPTAYIGFYKGIENWRNLLNKHKAKGTFFISTNCFSAKGETYEKIMKQLRMLLKEGHEIGLHVHPDSDLALQSLLGRSFSATSARFYSENELNDIIKAGKSLIKGHLGVNVTGIRWGNWALSTKAVIASEKNGFRIDSSATPGIKGHLNDDMFYDWSKVSDHYCWKLSKADYQNTEHKNSRILEIPIATFNFFGLKLRADPANSVLLMSCFDYYYNNANRLKPFVFVVISHSIEGTHQDGSTTKVIRVMDDFLSYASKFRDVRFSALKNSINK
ncbi:MAG: polysaccharide deacetylase family protein [Nanoarchaeota archaeon]